MTVVGDPFPWEAEEEETRERRVDASVTVDEARPWRPFLKALTPGRPALGVKQADAVSHLLYRLHRRRYF